MATETGPATRSGFFFLTRFFPVCAPNYLERHPISRAEELLDADLIDLDYIHWNWINWSIWFTESGLEQRLPRFVLRTNAYTAQLDAARAGLGVALGWAHLLEGDLEDGTLVRPIRESVATRYGYHVLLRDGTGDMARDISDRLLQSP